LTAKTSSPARSQFEQGFLHLAGACALAGLLAACGGGSSSGSGSLSTATVPGAPTAVTATAGDASTSLSFTAPASNGGAAVTGYTATCTAGGTSKTGAASSSPVSVIGLTNGTLYTCTVTGTNSAGTGASSSSVSVTPVATAAASEYPAVYKTLAWDASASVTYSGSCSMTISTTGVPPYHDAYYLAPLSTDYPTQVAIAPVSGLQLAVVPYKLSSIQGSIATIDICPAKAASTTSTNMGAIGYMLSGEPIYNAYEGSGTPAMSDNVSYTFTDSSGMSQTASFIDKCNSHATPLTAGYNWHYHGIPICLAATVDPADGPSHMIGIALDGFPIYGGRDVNGNIIALSALDTCNGIASPTPEFPNGIYHYVLPLNVTNKQSSLTCYSGTVSQVKLALAKAVACARRYARLFDTSGGGTLDRKRFVATVGNEMPAERNVSTPL
jgi:hypothetical protein